MKVDLQIASFAWLVAKLVFLSNFGMEHWEDIFPEETSIGNAVPTPRSFRPVEYLLKYRQICVANERKTSALSPI